MKRWIDFIVISIIVAILIIPFGSLLAKNASNDKNNLTPGYILQHYATYKNWMDPRAFMHSVPGEVLVKLRAPLYLSKDEANLNRNQLRKIEEPIIQDIKGYYQLSDAQWVTPHVALLKLNDNMSLDEVIATLKKDFMIEYAQPNYYYRVSSTIPNDPSFNNGDLWGLQMNPASSGGSNNGAINMPEAWDQVTDCSNVKVAVIDTGVDYGHPELKPNIWINQDEIYPNGLDDDNNGYVDDIIGWDFVQNDNDPMDYAYMAAGSHGSHVSGTIGAYGNNGQGVTGICWKVKIMPIRVMDLFGFGTDANLIKGIDYAIDKGANVINLSLGGPEGKDGDLLYQALSRARDKGILVSCAAGNEGAKEYYNNNRDFFLNYPSSYNLDNIVAVAACIPSGGLADFSNYGQDYVDLAAPGSSILSTSLTVEVPEGDGHIDWTDMLIYDESNPMEKYWSDDRRYPWFYGAMDYYGMNFPSFKDGFGYYAPYTNGSLQQIFADQLKTGQPFWDSFLTSALITQPIHLTPGTDFSYGIMLTQWSLGAGDVFVAFIRSGELKSSGLDQDKAENYIWDNSWDYVGVGGGYIDIQLALMSLEKFAGKTIQIAFAILSDYAGEGAGVYIFSLPSFGFPALSIESISTKNGNFIHEYMGLDGTSMATPHVSGVAALMKAKDPNITPAEIRQYMIETVTPGANLGDKLVSGGILNAAAALSRVSGENQQKQGNITFEPAFINFGAVKVGDTLNIKLKISNTGNDKLAITNSYVEDTANFSFEASPKLFIPANSSEVWRIYFKPTKNGVFRSNLVIHSTDPDSPTINIPLRGFGGSPTIPQ
jgi:subtilisin family serine protease